VYSSVLATPRSSRINLDATFTHPPLNRETMEPITRSIPQEKRGDRGGCARRRFAGTTVAWKRSAGSLQRCLVGEWYYRVHTWHPTSRTAASRSCLAFIFRGVSSLRTVACFHMDLPQTGSLRGERPADLPVQLPTKYEITKPPLRYARAGQFSGGGDFLFRLRSAGNRGKKRFLQVTGDWRLSQFRHRLDGNAD
jgi:hypothetical protein